MKYLLVIIVAIAVGYKNLAPYEQCKQALYDFNNENHTFTTYQGEIKQVTKYTEVDIIMACK